MKNFTLTFLFLFSILSLFSQDPSDPDIEFRKAYSDLRNMHEKLKADFEEERKTRKSFQAIAERLLNELNNAKKRNYELEELKKEITDLNNEINSLKASLNLKVQQYEMLRTELEDLKIKYRVSEARVSSFRRELVRTQEMYSEEVSILTKENNALQLEIKRLNKFLSAVKYLLLIKGGPRVEISNECFCLSGHVQIGKVLTENKNWFIGFGIGYDEYSEFYSLPVYLSGKFSLNEYYGGFDVISKKKNGSFIYGELGFSILIKEETEIINDFDKGFIFGGLGIGGLLSLNNKIALSGELGLNFQMVEQISRVSGTEFYNTQFGIASKIGFFIKI